MNPPLSGHYLPAETTRDAVSLVMVLAPREPAAREGRSVSVMSGFNFQDDSLR